jgi:Protein of unknown function (DUF2911)
MKKVLLTALVFAGFSMASTAQVKSPQPSPSASISQTIGLTDIQIDYSRPGVKGREIFGDLVPFGKVWRTGANKAVQFSTSTKITIEGKDVPAGNYALFTIPNEKTWNVMLYSETEIWGTPEKWIDSLEVLNVEVPVKKLSESMESFTISIDNIVGGSTADLSIGWSTTAVTIKIGAPTNEIAQESIDKTMAGPSANDYYRSASFYLEQKKDLKQAHAWIQKAVEMRGEEAFWMLRRQSLIEAELGMTKEAIATAKRSMASAEKAGNTDYVKMNKDSIEEWSK